MASFAETYDRYRPRPPEALLDLLAQLAGVEQPALVVDLGSGTGLSARAWAGRAERIVGVEPDQAMRAVAEGLGGVEYVAGTSAETGLPDACADVVTCSQSLHWLEPEPTFAEVARILRPGGVFAAYDYDPVPVVEPELDAAFDAVLDEAKSLRERTGLISPWTSGRPLRKDEHLGRMRARQSCTRSRWATPGGCSACFRPTGRSRSTATCSPWTSCRRQPSASSATASCRSGSAIGSGSGSADFDRLQPPM